jgi:hypothetical protein
MFLDGCREVCCSRSYGCLDACKWIWRWGPSDNWANVPEDFITFAVSFAFLELRTSKIDVDGFGGEVFDGVAVRALHPDLVWDLGAKQDRDLEQGRTTFILFAEGIFPISLFAPVIASNVLG